MIPKSMHINLGHNSHQIEFYELTKNDELCFTYDAGGCGCCDNSESTKRITLYELFNMLHSDKIISNDEIIKSKKQMSQLNRDIKKLETELHDYINTFIAEGVYDSNGKLDVEFICNALYNCGFDDALIEEYKRDAG